MKNANIANELKYQRKQNQLSVPEVSRLLSDENTFVADKTIYGWESGQAQPDADTLLKLCKIYHIDNVLSSFGYQKDTSPHIQPTTFELELIKQYRAHPEHQAAIHKLLDLE